MKTDMHIEHDEQTGQYFIVDDTGESTDRFLAQFDTQAEAESYIEKHSAG